MCPFMCRGFELTRARLETIQRLQQPCCFCGATPARNGSIYTWPEALGLDLCEDCSDWEIENAHPEYFSALDRDLDSASGNIGEVDAWLDTVIGQFERRTWERARAKGNGKGNARSRSRSPRRFEDLLR